MEDHDRSEPEGTWHIVNDIPEFIQQEHYHQFTLILYATIIKKDQVIVRIKFIQLLLLVIGHMSY